MYRNVLETLGIPCWISQLLWVLFSQSENSLTSLSLVQLDFSFRKLCHHQSKNPNHCCKSCPAHKPLPSLFWFEVSLLIWKLPCWSFPACVEGQSDKCRGTGVEKNCEHQLIQNPLSGLSSSCIFQLQGSSQSLCSAGSCFLRLCAVGKMFKAKPEELAQEGACNKLCCLALKIPEGTLWQQEIYSVPCKINELLLSF